MSTQIFSQFLNWVVFFLVNCKGSLYILDIIVYWIYDLEMFSSSLWIVFFHFLDSILLWCTKLFIFMKPNWSIFLFVACAFDVTSKNLLANLRFWSSIMFSPKTFIVLELTSWSLIHLESIQFLCTVWGKGLASFFCTWLCSCTRTICWFLVDFFKWKKSDNVSCICLQPHGL